METEKWGQKRSIAPLRKGNSGTCMTSEGYSLLNDSVKNDKTKSEEVAQFLKDEFNPQDMKSCLDSGKYDARLGEDITLARSIGVSGTPGFFVNATAFAGAYSWKDMESAVNAAL